MVCLPKNHSIFCQNTAGSLNFQLAAFRFLTFFSEFLIHAADVEGLCQGIDEELVRSVSFLCIYCFQVLIRLAELGEWVRIPTTYAGGAKGKYS